MLKIKEMMSDLSERQKLILALVIRDYIETAQPVGSVALVERYSPGYQLCDSPQ